jgi:hypothetical protein
MPQMQIPKYKETCESLRRHFKWISIYKIKRLIEDIKSVKNKKSGCCEPLFYHLKSTKKEEYGEGIEI